LLQVSQQNPFVYLVFSHTRYMSHLALMPLVEYPNYVYRGVNITKSSLFVLLATLVNWFFF
jgi:hypothetical protein